MADTVSTISGETITGAATTAGAALAGTLRGVDAAVRWLMPSERGTRQNASCGDWWGIEVG